MSYIPLSPNHHVVVVFKTKENEEETYLSLKRRSISSLLKLKANKTLTINGTFLLHVKFNNKGTTPARTSSSLFLYVAKEMWKIRLTGNFGALIDS